jgi:predicted DNA-binding ribbon-helix-helix protein
MFTVPLSDRRNLQITALVEELADNGHNVAGVVVRLR